MRLPLKSDLAYHMQLIWKNLFVLYRKRVLLLYDSIHVFIYMCLCSKSLYSYEKYRNKAEMKTRKMAILLWNHGRKEGQDDYLTSAAYTADLG